MDSLDIGNRMKTFYEQIPQTKLMRRCPVAIRLDGKAFRTFTRNLKKPFDRVLMDAMQETMLNLCLEIQGCVFGYTQSDEITLILIDYQTYHTEAWFDYEIQKMCSISASMATKFFNQFFRHYAHDFVTDNYVLTSEARCNLTLDQIQKRAKAYMDAENEGAMFDARCFNVPKEEVANLLYWRQLDAMRNSVQMIARANFSNSEIKNKSNKELKGMLGEIGIFWENFPLDAQRGSCCYRIDVEDAKRPRWTLDREIPIFIGDDRSFIEKHILVGEC